MKFIRTTRPRRGGITLTEVLISMGLITLGLVGVMALFPVGSFFLQQSDVSDRADAMAQAALNDAATRGMLDPENWLVGRRFNSTANAGYPTVFDQTLAGRLRDSIANQSLNFNAAPGTQARRVGAKAVNLNAGAVYVIDPLGVAASMRPTPIGGQNGVVSEAISFFPASVNFTQPFANNLNDTGLAAAGWWPWQGPPDSSNWPIRRVSVAQEGRQLANQPLAPRIELARQLAAPSDDLALEMPDEADSPSQQLWTQSGGAPMARTADGNYSFLLTVAPVTSEARNALASDPASFNYVVSAVVMHRRILGGTYDNADNNFFGHQDLMQGERLVRAAIVTTGVGGGQVLVYPSGQEINAVATREPPTKNLREGGWVMLFGPHPSSTPEKPILFCRWYEVQGVDAPSAAEAASGALASVFLSGPDWPWNVAGDPSMAGSGTVISNVPNGTPNDLRMVIVPDAVAVHSRTMQLKTGGQWGE